MEKIRNRSCPRVHCSELLVGSQSLRANAHSSLNKYTGMLCSWPWFTTIQSFTVEKGEFCFNLVWLLLQFPLFDVATVDDVSLKKADFPQPAGWITRTASPYFPASFFQRMPLFPWVSDVSIAPLSSGRIHWTQRDGLGEKVERTGKLS